MPHIAPSHFDPSAPEECEMVFVNRTTGVSGTIEVVIPDSRGRYPRVILVVNDTEASAVCRIEDTVATLEKLLVKHFDFPADWSYMNSGII